MLIILNSVYLTCWELILVPGVYRWNVQYVNVHMPSPGRFFNSWELCGDRWAGGKWVRVLPTRSCAFGRHSQPVSLFTVGERVASFPGRTVCHLWNSVLALMIKVAHCFYSHLFLWWSVLYFVVIMCVQFIFQLVYCATWFHPRVVWLIWLYFLSIIVCSFWCGELGKFISLINNFIILMYQLSGFLIVLFFFILCVSFIRKFVSVIVLINWLSSIL